MGGLFQSSSLAARPVGRGASQAPLRNHGMAYQNGEVAPRGHVYTPGNVNSCPCPAEQFTVPCSRMLAKESG
eukprot:11537793-Alexandrium_andersonii.AAC.1